MVGTSEKSSYFGDMLAAGHFDGYATARRYSDLAIKTYVEPAGGGILVIHGSPRGPLPIGTTRLWTTTDVGEPHPGPRIQGHDGLAVDLPPNSHNSRFRSAAEVQRRQVGLASLARVCDRSSRYF